MFNPANFSTFTICNVKHANLVFSDCTNKVMTSFLQEYIHRVGRTARAGGKGNALLLLMPEELGFLKYLKLAKVNT